MSGNAPSSPSPSLVPNPSSTVTLDIKLVLLGHKNVGKTSIFNRFVYDEFGKTSMTIGAYFGMKTIVLSHTPEEFSACGYPPSVPFPSSTTVNLACWDTAGEEKFDSLTNFYCRNALSSVICYDVTSGDTFTQLNRWLEKIRMEADPSCSIVIVGNKIDMVKDDNALRKVDYVTAKQFASNLSFGNGAQQGVGVHVVEVSAKTGEKINETFDFVIRQAVLKQHCINAKKGLANGNQQRKTVKVTQTVKKEEEGGCC